MIYRLYDIGYYEEYDLIRFIKISLVEWRNRTVIFMQMEAHAINWNKKQNSLRLWIVIQMVSLKKFNAQNQIVIASIKIQERVELKFNKTEKF